MSDMGIYRQPAQSFLIEASGKTELEHGPGTGPVSQPLLRHDELWIAVQSSRGFEYVTNLASCQDEEICIAFTTVQIRRLCSLTARNRRTPLMSVMAIYRQLSEINGCCPQLTSGRPSQNPCCHRQPLRRRDCHRLPEIADRSGRPGRCGRWRRHPPE
jgi:hypothetical protein